MNSVDAMIENADPASTELDPAAAAVMPRDASTSWEPHEVWLSRVKLPRDRAALRRAEAPAVQ